jgi:penicillin-binding protein 1A
MAGKSKTHNIDSNVKRLWKFFIYFLLFMILLFLMIGIGVFGKMPSAEELSNPASNLASEVISADQVVLGKFFKENRSNISYAELPPHLVNALVATEDVRFERHSGIDGRGLGRVFVKTIIGRSGSSGGGSTITQQLAKNMFPRPSRRNIFTVAIFKFKEWITAVKLERTYSKPEIIALYLNTVDFGSLSFGIKSAAKTYYGKSVDSLRVEESALLVGMLKAPTLYSPVRNPENAMKRRSVVLNQMRKADYITREEYDSLKVIPIDMSNYKIQDHTAGLAPYLREQIRMFMDDWGKEHRKPNGEPYNIYKDGLRIYTTINSRMQDYAEKAVEEHLAKDLQPAFFQHWKGRKNAPFFQLTQEEVDKLMEQAKRRSDRYRRLKESGASKAEIDKSFNTPAEMRVFSWNGEIDTVMTPMDSIRYYKFFLRAGLMAVEPQTGYVRAYVGGINYKHFQYDQVYTAKRQVGSTFKPFVYALAIQELGYTPCTTIPNIPVTFVDEIGRSWTPKNSSDYKDMGMMSLKEALAHSVNRVSAYLMKRLSPQGVVNLVNTMGVKSEIPPVPAICLGTPDLSVYEMVGAMATFANKGVYNQPIFITRIEDRNGNVIESFVSEQKEAMSVSTAWMMLEMMKGVVQTGTGTRLRGKYAFSYPVAGKTGTTDNNSDGWFMGLTPDLVAGVWVGCEDRGAHFRSTALGQGANMALPIWALFMKKVYADGKITLNRGDFERPETIGEINLNCNNFDIEPPEFDDGDDFNDGF